MSKEADFLVFCIEKYAEAKGLAPHKVLELFDASGVTDYVLQNYGALHTLGPEYLIDDLSALLA